MRPLSVLIVLLVLLLHSAITSMGCSLCEDGSDITKPDVVVGLTEPISIETCADLASILGFIGDEDELCLRSRSLSTLCGCPVSENACRICADGAELTRPQQQLDGLIDLGSTTPSFGLSLTCALLESSASVYTNDQDKCTNLPFDDLRKYCGCPNSGEEDTNQCSFCPGGEILASILRQDDKVLTVNGEMYFCSSLLILSNETTKDTDLCKEIQQVSNVCGCPVSENACNICEGGDLLDGLTLTTAENGEVITCNTAQARLRNVDSNSSKCNENNIEAVSSLCGCSQGKEFIPCTLCPNGEPSPYPDKDIVGIDGIGFDYIEHNCGVFDQSLIRGDETSSLCVSARTTSYLCGCTSPIENHCTMCQPGETMRNPFAEYFWAFGDIASFGEEYDLEASTGRFDISRKWTCELAESFLAGAYTNDDELCYHATLHRGHSCGCPSNAETIALVWTQRASGTLSLVGSLIILVSILFKKKKVRWSPYNQIVMSISLFDCCSSIGYIFGSALTPAEVGIYGSIGNEQTCGFQAFLFQIGIASIYYNLVLSVYFVMIVKYRWNARKLKRVQWWVHGAVCGVALIMAFAVIPFATPDWRWCYVSRPPFSENWIQGILFFIVPVGVSLLSITAMTLILVSYVRMTHLKTQGQRLGPKSKQNISTRAFWQSMWFLAVFYTVWPIQFAAFITPLEPKNYWVFFLAALLGPLQGFLNSLVVFARDRKDIVRRAMSSMGFNKSSDTSDAKRSSFLSNPFSRSKGSAELAVQDENSPGDMACLSLEEVAQLDVGVNQLEDFVEAEQSPEKRESLLKEGSIRIEKLLLSKDFVDVDCNELSDGLLEHVLDSGLLDNEDMADMHESIARIEANRE